MSAVSMEAVVHTESRSVSIAHAGEGFALRTDKGARRFRTFNQALHEGREYLGPFLARAERRPTQPWGLRVCVSAGCAFYGPNPPRSVGGGGAPVPPAELLAKIRSEYHEGGGPLAALNNAIKVARAYPPEEAREAA
jgi:hypothetical protein